MSQRKSNKISRRQAVAASLGAVGTAAVSTTGALAEPRPSRLVKDKQALVLIGEFSEGLETYYMIYRLIVDEPVVVDGSLVTSRGWPDLPYFMPKFLEALAGK